MNAVQKFITAVNDTGSKQWAMTLIASFLLVELCFAITSYQEPYIQVPSTVTPVPSQTPAPKHTPTSPTAGEDLSSTPVPAWKGDDIAPYYCSGCGVGDRNRMAE